jgi:hypothetical protein
MSRNDRWLLVGLAPIFFGVAIWQIGKGNGV